MAITWEKAVADYKKNNAGSSTASTHTSGTLTWQQAVDEYKKYGAEEYKALGQKRIAERQQAEIQRTERASVSDWMDRYNRVMQGVSAYDKERNGGYTQDASGGYGSSIDSLIADYEGIKGIAGQYGFQDSDKYLGYLKELQESIGQINDSFSQFEDENAYNRYLEYWQDQEEKRNLDLDAYSRETAALEQQLKDYAPEYDWTDNKQREAVDAEIKRMQDEIQQRKQYLAQAQEAQDLAAISEEDIPELERYIENRKAARVQSFNQSLTALPASYEDSYLIEKYGRKRLDEIAESYQRSQNRQAYADAYTAGQTAADNGKFSSNVKSIATALGGNVLPYLTQIAEGGYGTGRYDPLDPYTAGNRAAAYTSGVRGRTAEHLSGDEYDESGNKIKDGGTLRQLNAYAYQGLMEAADSGVRLAAGGGNGDIAGVLAALGSFAQSYAEDSGKGATFAQALTSSATKAGIEYLTEKIGLDNLFDIASSGKKPLMKSIGNILKQAGVEAAEEELSLIGSLLAEGAILREKSSYNQQIAQLMQEGMTEAEARRQANLDLLKEAGETFLISAFSGGISGVPAEIYAGAADRFANRNATEVPNNATELANNATPALEKSTPGGVTEITAATAEKSPAVDDKMSATESTVGKMPGKNENPAVKVGVSKMETVQLTKDIDSFARQFGTQVDAVRRNYIEGQDLQEYEVGFQAAYAMGLEGGKTEALNEKTAPYLSQSQREIAYSLGRDAAAAQKAVAPKSKAFASGKLASDGVDAKPVNVAEIVSMDDTSMTFRLEDGRTVTDDDLDFDNGKQLLSAAWDLDMDVASVNTILRESAGTAASDADLAAGIQQAHHYGVHGYTMEQLKQHGSDASVLTDGQRKTAWEAGRKIYLQQNEAPAAAAKVSKVSGVWFDNGGGNVVAFDDYDISGVSKAAVAGVRAAQVLQKLGIGSNFYFFESYENEAGDRVYKDENGVEKKAPNGWYDPADGSIHIDLNAGADGKGLTLYTLSHELTHKIEKEDKQAYRRLAEFLVANYSKYGNVDAMVAEKQAELSAGRGSEVSYEEAYSEFIADSMEAMLADGNVLEKLQELKKTDRSLFDKIKEFFDNLARKIREIYKDLKPDSFEGQAVLQMRNQIDEIQQLFAEALMEVSENFQASEEVGLEVDMETESVAPSVMYSERTWRESDYVQERNKAAEEIHKAIGVSVKKAKQYIDSVNSIAKMIAEDRTRLDYFSSPGRSSFIGNVEYGGSFDFSTLCKKRRLLTGTFTAIQKALPNTALTANEILDIRNRMKEAGLEVSCGLCYVEGSRANMGQFAKEFLRLYKQYYPDAWQPNMADVNTPDGIEWVRINHPECYEQYEYFWNHYGTLKAGDKNLFASQQKPKLYQLHTEYKGEILQKFKGDDNVEEKNLNGGIRLQSFSDFEIVHLIDTMQIIMDMSRVGLAGQAYTKVPDFAWALGDTGLKINLSLIAKDVDADGNLIFDDIEGMPIAEAMRLRDRYSANVGTILVAFNDAQLMAAMKDSRVDFIIPFHRSQWKKSQYEAMGLPAKTKDYTFMQNEKFIKPQYHEYRGRMVKDKATNYMPNEYWDFSKSGKENAIAYLEMCARNNKRPKFYKLLQNNGDGSYSLKADGSTDGYWKLLIDFKMYDNDGNGSPQTAVRPDFNMTEATRMMREYKGGHSSFPVAQGIVDSFVSEYKESHGERMYSERKKSGEYGGIREVLAKQGLDELSVKLGDRFPLSAKFDEVMKNDHTDLIMETVNANSVMKGRKESAYKVGRKAFTSKFGAKTRIHITQMDIDADLYADVANESISKAIGQANEQSTLDVIPHVGDILSNSVLMGIERIAHTDNKGTALYGYRLYNLYWYVDRNKKTPHALVCTVVQDLTKAEGYVFKNIENVTIDRGLPGSNTGMSSSVNSDTYTVAQLYDAVKKINRNDGGLKYSPDDRNTYLFSYTERNDGVAYQSRATGTSNRALLAGAFEDLARSPAEMEFLQKYQENIGHLNEQERKLQEIRSEIRQISFSKGPRDAKRLQALQEEATKTANRIDIYDKRLLKLETAKPLQDVLEREKEKVRKATRQKGQEALENYREKRKESAARKDAKRKIRRAVMDLDKLLNRGDKKKHVKDGMTSMVGSVLKLADALFMDEYTNRDMLRNGVGVELTDAEEKLFREAQQLMQQVESGAAIEGMEFASEIDAMDQLKKLDQKLSSKMAGLKDVFARERKRLYGTTVSDLLGKLADEYSRLSEAEDGAIRAAKDENVYAHLLQLKTDVGGTTVRDMSLSQLEQVADAFTMVLTTVRNANKMFAGNLQFKRDTLAGMVMSEIGSTAKKLSKLVAPGKDLASVFTWNNLKPVYAFERLGSGTLKTMYQNIRKGQDVWSRDMQEADAFRREQYKKHSRKQWDLQKQHSFAFESGKVELSLEQIMSLYAYSRREAALDHLLKGGFVFSGNTEVLVKKNGIQRRYLKKDATAYNLSADELMQVIGTLTEEQKAFVVEMQTYLSDVMGGKGNEVSMQMYGIKSFGEKNYFPLRSAGQYMEKAKEDSFRKEQGQISIVNSGFTKATTPHASNPITLDGFMNVWAEHVNDMSMYHGFVLPMEDFRRVYNYSSPHVEEGSSQSVNAAIENAFGKAATGYIDQLYKDLNGGAVSDNRETFAKKLVGLHKKAAVFASASVVIQQPSAIVRAFALIDPRHFVGPKVDRKRHKLLWEEMKQYAPVAFVKEMGYFDTGMGRSARDFLQAEDDHVRWFDAITKADMKAIARNSLDMLRDSDYRDSILSWAPSMADEITWCSIWEAVKRETKQKNPGMDVKSDAFLQIAGERFAEVIDKTQVYDSVLSRSANMRSKSGLMNMVTSFLAEPTTSINMLEDALRKGDRKQLGRTVGAVYGSVLLNSLLVSLVYAARDDEEDETCWEKYLSSVATEMLDGINPITYYPILRDIWSTLQGFDVERADMTLISDFADAAKKMVSAGLKVRNASEEELDGAMAAWKDSMWGLTDSVASLAGIPVKNIRRDIEAGINLYRTIGTDLAGRKTTLLSLQDAVLADVIGSIPIGGLLYDKSKRDRLYGAIMAGDTVYAQRLKSGYETDSSYHSAIRQALRDHDSRIWEAAVAWNAGELETYIPIAKEIRGESRFEQDDIVLAIRAEASSMEEKESSSSDKVYGYFTAEKFGVAIGQNNTTMADMIRQDLIDTDIANGKTQEEAEKSVQSKARSQLKELYTVGAISKSAAEKMLVKYGGYDRDSASNVVTQWQYEMDHPELDGRITYNQYKRWEADGKGRGVALETFTEVAEYQDSGTSGSDRSQTEVAEYINRLPISTAQKDALWCCFWKESTLYKAPWH